MRRIIAIVACAWLFAGCQTWNSASAELQLLTAQKSYSNVVDALAAAREQGAFTTEQAAAISVPIHAGQAYLNQWAEALLAGQPVPDHVESGFAAVLNELQTYLERGAP